MRFRIDPKVVEREGLSQALLDMEFELEERMTFREIMFVERISRTTSDDWTRLFRGRARVWLSIRRVNAKLITWEAMADLASEDFLDVDDEDEADQDEAAALLGDEQDDPQAAAQREQEIEEDLAKELATPTMPAATPPRKRAARKRAAPAKSATPKGSRASGTTTGS